MPRRVARRTIGLDGRFPRLCRRTTTTRMTIEQYRRIRGEIDGRAYPSRARAYSLSLCLFLLIQRSRTILYPLYPREMMQAKIVGHAPPFDDTIYPDIYRAPVKLKTRERSLTLIFRSCDTNWVVAPWLTARALCRRAGRFSPKPNPGVTKIEIGERTGARQDAHVRRRRRSSTHIVRAAAACRVSSLRVSSLRSAPHVPTCSLRSVSLACASVCAHVISPFHSQFAAPPLSLFLSLVRSLFFSSPSA